jgi:hypothetical protein
MSGNNQAIVRAALTIQAVLPGHQRSMGLNVNDCCDEAIAPTPQVFAMRHPISAADSIGGMVAPQWN